MFFDRSGLLAINTLSLSVACPWILQEPCKMDREQPSNQDWGKVIHKSKLSSLVV